MKVENNHITLDQLKCKYSSNENAFSGEISQKVKSILTRLELHDKTQIKISRNLTQYTNNSKKIYVHIIRLSNLWAIYESLFDLLENFFKPKIFLKNIGRGKLVNGYLKEFANKKAIKYSITIELTDFFDYILEKSLKFPHNDGLLFLSEIKKYLNYLIKENVRVKQTSNNNLIKQVIDKLDLVCELKTHNYRKKKNTKKLDDKVKILTWQEFLALIYAIRNQVYHNSHIGIESIDNQKAEKLLLIFLLNLYEMFYQVIINLFWDQINEYTFSIREKI